MLEMYKGFVENYGVITIEDPYEQDDWDNWKAITADVSCQIVGDDQLVTNPTRIKKAIEQKASNALLLKVRRSAAVTVICAAVLSHSCRWCSGSDA
jgi:enolase